MFWRGTGGGLFEGGDMRGQVSAFLTRRGRKTDVGQLRSPGGRGMGLMTYSCSLNCSMTRCERGIGSGVEWGGRGLRAEGNMFAVLSALHPARSVSPSASVHAGRASSPCAPETARHPPPTTLRPRRNHSCHPPPQHARLAGRTARQRTTTPMATRIEPRVAAASAASPSP
jgi:hypothetical protein